MSIFNFFKKEEKPYIKVWSSVPGLEEVCPPVSPLECLPDWFKTMPKDVTRNAVLHPGTAKRCPSFVDYFSQGIVIKLWCDVALSIKEDNTYEVYTPEDVFQFKNHGNEQFLDHIPNQGGMSMVLKALCPWRIMTPPGWSVLQLPMAYNFDADFTVLPGTIWTDIHHEVNQQMAFHKPGEYLLKRGTPLATYIPFKREKVELQIERMTPELQHRNQVSYYWWASKFKGGYKEHQAIIKKGDKDAS